MNSRSKSAKYFSIIKLFIIPLINFAFVILSIGLFSISQLKAEGLKNQKTNQSEISKLAPRIGVWKITEGVKETNFNHPKENYTKAICQWSPDSQFVVCDIIQVLPTGRTHSLGVYAFNSTTGNYSYYGVGPEGGKPDWGNFKIQDSLWTFFGQFKSKGKTFKTKTINLFVSPDTIQFKYQIYTKKKRWFTISKGIEEKIK